MKKLAKLLAAFLTIFGICSCSLFGSNSGYEDSEEIKLLKEKGQFIELSLTEVKELCTKEDNFIFYVKTTSCSQCHYYSDEIVKVLNEDETRKIYCVVYDNMDVEEQLELADIAYDLLGEDYYEVQGWDDKKPRVPLTIQVVDGKMSNARCGFLAAKYLRYLYTFNFFNLDYLSNVLDKFEKDDEFTLHMSTVGGDDENTYLNALYDEYKNNPLKSQGYYFNLYKLDNDEKIEFLNRINSSYISDGQEEYNPLESLPSKFEITVKNGKVISITVLE